MNDTHPSAFNGVPSSALTARLYEIRREERALLVEFLRTLAEVEARSVHLELAFPSLFAFLTDHLGYTKSSAFRRSTAARLLARFPAAADYLADGRLGLTTFVELRTILDEEHATEILDRASGKTEEQVKLLVASYKPREAPPDLLRRMPMPASAGPEPAIVAPCAIVPPSSSEVSPPAPREPQRPVRIEPISEELRTMRVTVGREFYADFEAARAALSHVIPDGDLVAVLHEGLRRVVRDHHRRRAAETDRPRTTSTVGSDGRAPAAAVRREVWRRDGGRCAFVAADGRRCGSTHQLQFHHIHPFALGGPSTASNVMLACAMHNAHFAVKDFGAEHMARARSPRRAEVDPDDRTQMSLL